MNENTLEYSSYMTITKEVRDKLFIILQLNREIDKHIESQLRLLKEFENKNINKHDYYTFIALLQENLYIFRKNKNDILYGKE